LIKQLFISTLLIISIISCESDVKVSGIILNENNMPEDSKKLSVVEINESNLNCIARKPKPAKLELFV
jgi:hypothetical protein